MSFVTITGTLATCASLVIICIGLPAQIWKNYQRKSCAGLSKTLIFTAFFAYTFWALYGWTKPDFFIKIAQTPGFILGSILVIQMFYYPSTEETAK